jgi:hypothetical protein
MPEIKHNTCVKCLVCGAELVSRHRHDFIMCSCENRTFADGGSDYSRIGGKDLEKIARFDYELNKFINVRTGREIEYETKI